MSEQGGLDELMVRYAELYRKTKADIEEMETAEKAIKEQVREMGHAYAHGDVTADWRKGSTRTTWDGKALEGYAAAHPEILPFKTVTETQASVSLKVKAAN